MSYKVLSYKALSGRYLLAKTSGSKVKVLYKDVRRPCFIHPMFIFTSPSSLGYLHYLLEFSSAIWFLTSRPEFALKTTLVQSVSKLSVSVIIHTYIHVSNTRTPTQCYFEVDFCGIKFPIKKKKTSKSF